MKGFFRLVVIALLAVNGSYSQTQVFTPNLWSEELSFMAEFPETPRESSIELDTRFGVASGRNWKVERPEITFEISVLHYAEAPVEMEMKSLQRFYKILCGDMIGAPNGGYGDNFFSEEGMSCSRRVGKRQDLYLRLFLIRNRLYLATVVSEIGTRNTTERNEEAKHFLDSLHLAHIDPTSKKLVYGMPKSFSQNLEAR